MMIFNSFTIANDYNFGVQQNGRTAITTDFVTN